MTPARAKEQRAADAAERREAEARCALRYLLEGDGVGDADEQGGWTWESRHAEDCVHARAGADPCSRIYDPLPYPEAEPDPRLHAGTGIGALYGHGGDCHLWQLAGWTLNPRSTR